MVCCREIEEVRFQKSQPAGFKISAVLENQQRLKASRPEYNEEMKRGFAKFRAFREAGDACREYCRRLSPAERWDSVPAQGYEAHGERCRLRMAAARRSNR